MGFSHSDPGFFSVSLTLVMILFLYVSFLHLQTFAVPVNKEHMCVEECTTGAEISVPNFTYWMVYCIPMLLYYFR